MLIVAHRFIVAKKSPNKLNTSANWGKSSSNLTTNQQPPAEPVERQSLIGSHQQSLVVYGNE